VHCSQRAFSEKGSRSKKVFGGLVWVNDFFLNEAAFVVDKKNPVCDKRKRISNKQDFTQTAYNNW
jgi:hypothetical protein